MNKTARFVVDNNMYMVDTQDATTRKWHPLDTALARARVAMGKGWDIKFVSLTNNCEDELRQVIHLNRQLRLSVPGITLIK